MKGTIKVKDIGIRMFSILISIQKKSNHFSFVIVNSISTYVNKQTNKQKKDRRNGGIRKK